MNNLHIDRFIESIKHTFTNVVGALAFLLSLLLSTDAKMILFFFIFFLLLDYGTGIFASWVEHKKSGNKAEVFVVRSEKLRSSFTKVIGYCIIITFSLFLNHVFIKDDIIIMGATPPLSLVEIALSGCCAIEFLSNLENLKRSGFDIIGKLSNGFKTVWSLIRQAKGEEK